MWRGVGGLAAVGHPPPPQWVRKQWPGGERVLAEQVRRTIGRLGPRGPPPSIVPWGHCNGFAWVGARAGGGGLKPFLACWAALGGVGLPTTRGSVWMVFFQSKTFAIKKFSTQKCNFMTHRHNTHSSARLAINQKQMFCMLLHRECLHWGV